MAFPFRVIYVKTEKRDVPVSIIISVSKKRFHKATDRNRIKRLTREAYRCQKGTLYDVLRDKNYSLAIAFIYNSPQISSYKSVCRSIAKSMHKIANGL